MNNESPDVFSNENTASARADSVIPETVVKRRAEREETNRRRKQSSRNKLYLIAAVALLLVVLIVIITVSCSRPSIKGRWDLDGTTVYEFYDGGKGALVLMTGKYEFNYKTDGDLLYIDFVDDRALDSSYEYQINKDALFLTGGPGDAKNQFVLTRD